MNTNLRSLRGAIAGAAVASLTLGLAATAVAPAASAADTRITMPTPSVIHSVANQGNATTSGAIVMVGDATYRVTVGGAVVANFGDVTYKAGTTPQGWRGNWYACSSAKQDLATCSLVKSQPSQGNVSADNATVTYVATAADLGKFLAFRGEVYGKDIFLNQNVSQGASTDRAKDLRVIPFGVPSSPRPVIGTNNVVAGQAAGLITGVWTMPTDQTFVSRTVTAWACPDANAGQSTSADFSTAGCIAVPVTNSSIAATDNRNATHSLTTTAAMGGRYLVASSALVARAGNGTPYLYVVRSAATLLPPSAGGAVTAAADAAATPDANAAATTTTPSANAGVGAVVDGAVAAPVQPTLTIQAKSTVNRGKKLLVTVKLAGKGGGTLGTGPAKVELVKTQKAGAKAVKVLKPIEVENMRGAKYEPIGKKFKKGAYFLRVIFTDAGSGVQSASLKKVTIR